METEALHKKVEQELKKENPDYNLISFLSSQIAASNANQVSLSIDSSLISRLGRELVVKQETAVSELIKNAYDADATDVNVKFIDTNMRGGTLVIEDNGVGMTKPQLLNNFLRIGTSNKLINSKSARYKRRVSGQKGIGRIATQRLGKKLTVLTKALDNPGYKVEIDWDLYGSGNSIFNISFPIDEVDLPFKEGTHLIISNLVEKWSEDDIKKVYKYILDVIQPFPLSKKAISEEKKKKEHFLTTCIKIENGKETKIEDVTKVLYDLSAARIDATVGEDGIGTWSIESKILEFNDSNNKIGEFKSLKSVKLRAYYYIYRSGLIPKQQETRIKELAKERGGIRVYRNGFRVLPYGEPTDDWLGLDFSSANRHILAPHQNINFLGVFEIDDPEGTLFEEAASREGLLNNTAFFELKKFGYAVLTAAAIRVAEVRGRKVTASQKDWVKEQRPIERIKEIAEDLTKSINTFQQKEEPQLFKHDIAEKKENIAKKIISDIQEIQELVKDQQNIDNTLLEEISMLRVLASLGITIGEFTHEMRHYLPAIQLDLDSLKEKTTDFNQVQIINRLLENVQAFKAYIGYFDKSISDNTRRELKPLELRDIVRAFLLSIRPALERGDFIAEDPIYKGARLFTLPMHHSEWSSILFNLYTNARKAIKTAGVVGRIRIEAGKEGSNVYLKFEDNGIGIPIENKSRIFNPFFTTSTPSEAYGSDVDIASGSGLGLHIIKQIIEGYGGSIELVEPSPSFNTAFYIKIPAATKNQIIAHNV